MEPHESPPRIPNGVEAESIELAYNEVLQLQPLLLQRSESIDNKVVAVFSISSIIVTVAPSIGDPSGTLSHLLWMAALIFWLASAWNGYRAFMPRTWRIGPDPQVMLQDAWSQKDAKSYRYYRLWYMGQSYSRNVRECNDKASFLKREIWFTALETLMIALALIF